MNKLVQQFLASPQITALAPATQRNYRDVLSVFESFMVSIPDVVEMDAEILNTLQSKERMENFTQWLAKNKKSGKTIAQYVTIIKLFARFHDVPFSFSYKISSFEKKKQQLKSVNRWLSDAEVEACLAYGFPESEADLRTRNRLLVRLVVETGARIREIANIAIKDFDLSNRTVFLECSKTEPRPAFYSKETAGLLYNFLEESLFLPLTHKIFPETKQCMGIIYGMLKDLGLKKDRDGRGPHTFRHYVATRLYYDQGMNLTDLAIILGDRPDTIRENYLHPTPAMMRKRMGAAMGWE